MPTSGVTARPSWRSTPTCETARSAEIMDRTPRSARTRPPHLLTISSMRGTAAPLGAETMYSATPAAAPEGGAPASGAAQAVELTAGSTKPSVPVAATRMTLTRRHTRFGTQNLRPRRPDPSAGIPFSFRVTRSINEHRSTSIAPRTAFKPVTVPSAGGIGMWPPAVYSKPGDGDVHQLMAVTGIISPRRPPGPQDDVWLCRGREGLPPPGGDQRDDNGGQ